MLKNISSGVYPILITLAILSWTVAGLAGLTSFIGASISVLFFRALFTSRVIGLIPLTAFLLSVGAGVAISYGNVDLCEYFLDWSLIISCAWYGVAYASISSRTGFGFSSNLSAFVQSLGNTCLILKTN